MATVLERIRRHDTRPFIGHWRVYGNANTLCGLPSGAAAPVDDKAGLGCQICTELEKKLATPEGELILKATGRIDVSPDCWKLASYVCKINSKLATELADARERIEALYKPRRDPLEDPGQASPL